MPSMAIHHQVSISLNKQFAPIEMVSPDLSYQDEPRFPVFLNLLQAAEVNREIVQLQFHFR